MKKFRLLYPCVLALSFFAFGQQTGSISGDVTASDGAPLPGVVITAEGNTLPRPRSTVSNARGFYRFDLLPPGNYELTYTMSGMATAKRKTRVLLQQNTVVNVQMSPEASAEELVVTAEVPLIDTSSSELKAAVTGETFDKIPLGQEYRDLVKLIPGVQYTEDVVRGPSAGGSGQDNVYLFDGVNVTLPLFGTLSAEPSSHDIAEISVVKGGAKAYDFNRSGGFTINSISKAGTNRFQGEVSFQIQDSGLTEDEDTTSSAVSDEDKTWAVASIGGPIVKDRLFFYTSYYGPTVQRDNRANLYGEVPDFESDRDELFFKLTFSPTENLTLNASYRDSERDVTASGVGGEATAGTSSQGSTNTLEIGIFEGSWIINDRSSLNFKYTDFGNETSGRPDILLGNFASIDGSGSLDVNNLDRQGQFFVPVPRDGLDEFNAAIAPLIDRYGYLENGVRNGGGVVGVADLINNQDFFRESFQVGYNYLLTTGNMTHDFHVGYQRYEDSEDLQRSSNGWGEIGVIGGQDSENPDVFYQARFWQGSLQAALGDGVAVVHSEFQSQNFEFNDTITWGDWTFNLGFMASNDELIGQGLEADPTAVSGFRINQNSSYTMKEIDWDEQIAPRLGAVWNFNETDTVYGSWSRYYPAATSLPRAASWARNLVGRRIDAFFDVNGNFLGATEVRSSSGKFFQEGLTPRSTDEIVAGYSASLPNGWTGKAHYRYRYSHNFWEDTNNNARARFGNTDEIRAQPDYIPNLGDFRDEIGGSSYVIAELDGSYSKYHEVSLDGEWRSDKAYFKGTYVWSHYYGNMDQDNTTTENDGNFFIGSSNVADGAGRQLWDNKEGNLRGDRRHMIKLYSFYTLPWNGSVGAFGVFQSGQPWEVWDVNVYRHLTGSSSDTIRFAEPAGSRRTSSHYQLDLNYTQNFQVGDRVEFGGFYGDITAIGLRSVRLQTLDDNTVTIPNSKFLSDITSSGNFGALDMQVVMDFHIGIDQDFDRAQEIVREAALSSRYVLLSKPIVVQVVQAASSALVSVRLRLKAYVLDARYEKTFETDVNLRVLRAFRQEGIRAPVLTGPGLAA